MTISAQRTSVYVLLLLWSCVAAAQAGQEMQTVRVTEGPTITYVDDQFAVVAWTTNVPTESRVFYGIHADDLNQVAESLQASTLHRVDLRNLKPDTTYYFQLDTPGPEIPPVLQFRTVAAGAAPLRRQPPGREASAQPAPATGVTITRGPTIEFADDRSAVISWTTNEPAPTLVYYGTRRSDLSQTAEAGGNTTFHRVHLSGLQPATTYFFLVDSGQGQQTGQVNSFETAAAEGAPIYSQHAMAAGNVAAPPSNAPALGNRPPEERPRRRSGKEVPAGIEIQATLQDELSTKTSHYGDKFTAIVSQPVNASDGSMGIPAGSKITGEVIESEQGKTVALLRGRGKINIRFRDLILPDGTTLPLNAGLESVHNMKANEEGQVQGGIGGKTAAKDVGVGAGLGTVAGLIFGSALKGLAIGAIAGGGYMLATKGKDVEIPANSGMVLRLEQALYVPAHSGE